MMNKTLCLLAGLLFIAGFSCKKENDTIPNVPVNIYISTTDPNFVSLNAVGGWVYVTGGVQGIVVYRKSQNEFVAFDRNCSYKPSSGNRVNVDSSTNLFLVDGSCGSKFLITDGSVQSGPAILPLKRYNASFDGVTVHIFN